MKISNLKIFTLSILLLGVSYVTYDNMSKKDTITQSEIKYLPYELQGNRNSDFLLVFLHGYPNTVRMWDNMIKDLEKDYYCLNISYPNYSEKLQLKWGMDLKDIVDLIKDTIEHVEHSSEGDKKYKKILISHDWGAFFAYLLSQKYENYFSDIVTMDLGVGIDNKIKTKLFVLAYQGYLISNFLIGGPIGKYMTRLFVKLANPYGLTENDYNRIDSSWNYPYYQIWRSIMYYKNILDKFQPTTSIVYVYGKNKPFNFHSDKFLDQLRNCEKCEVHELDSDHWLMRKPENSKFLIDMIRRRSKYFK